MENLGTLALGALLIIGVLFIGYKMDTASERVSTKKAPKMPKVPKKQKVKVKEEYVEEVVQEIDEDMPYDSEEDEFFSNNSVNEYEDEDVSLFGASEEIESTFNNDIDDSIFFNIGPKQEHVKETDVPKNAVDIKEEYVEPVKEDDFSSTMIFNTDKLNSELDEIDKLDHVDEMVAMLNEFGKSESLPEEIDDYTDPVYGIDEKLKELDEEDGPKPLIDGPIKPSADDAESFMNELKKLKESAEAEDFSGFAVDNKDRELKDTHKRYTKKKSEDDLPEIEVPKIPFTADENEESLNNGGIDLNFLAQMEKNLKQTQKERLSQKKTTKKSTKKKDE